MRWDGQLYHGRADPFVDRHGARPVLVPRGGTWCHQHGGFLLAEGGKNSIWLPIPTANVQLRRSKSYCEEQFLFYGQTLEAAGDLRAFLLEKSITS